MDLKLLLMQSSLFGAGLMINSYEINAKRMGWPVGEWFSEGSWLCGLGGLSSLIALVGAVFGNPWWSLFLVLVIGFVFGSLVPMFLRKHTQLFSVLLLIMSYVMLSIYCY